MAKNMQQLEKNRYMVSEETKLFNFSKSIIERLKAQGVIKGTDSLFLFIGSKNKSIGKLSNSFK
jgi:hypothetical protein